VTGVVVTNGWTTTTIGAQAPAAPSTLPPLAKPQPPSPPVAPLPDLHGPPSAHGG
jgi:hypothetical protein